MKTNLPLVRTIGERCRTCYTCVRECPAKAIRIVEGQAEVLPERCIGCGNCVRVCSQQAKDVLHAAEDVERMLGDDGKVAACVAPSFPADLDGEVAVERFVGMIRALGFDWVHEVSFGADLVAAEYRRLLETERERRFIATSCPAIVGFVERYHPDLIPSLAPIVSPMVAAARVIHRLHGEDVRIVFIGPCIAKKAEAASTMLPDDLDAALTFTELHAMFARHGIAPEAVAPGDFDPPHGGLGGLFPVSRGMLQAAHIDEDLVAGEVVAADGRIGFADAIKEFEAGDLDVRLLEVLCCHGCIMGAGMRGEAPLFRRRSQMSQYMRRRMKTLDREQWEADLAAFADLDLSRRYQAHDQRIAFPSREEVRAILRRMGKEKPEDELNCGACGYDTCVEHAVAIHKGLAESEMCLPNTIEQLRETVAQLGFSNEALADTQQALVQSEKLASMGQLAAGIAHEVNNPLGVVLMYTHLLMEESRDDGQREDLQMVVEQADRCKKIVAELLHFARQNKVLRQPVNVEDLVQQCLRTIPAPADVTTAVHREVGDTMAELDGDQIAQVLTNLVTNAYAAMPDGGSLVITIAGDAENVTVEVADTGKGITPANRAKIFEPFFTTKQIGEGTGLGLAVTYGIVKMHRGDIAVESNPDPAEGPTGTAFRVTLPRREETNWSRGDEFLREAEAEQAALGE